MIVECTNCRAFVEAQEQGSFQHLRPGEEPSGRYVLLNCNKCASPLLVHQINIGNMAEGDIWDTPTQLYPPAEQRSNPNAPREIQTAFEEAWACYRARAYTAAPSCVERRLKVFAQSMA